MKKSSGKICYPKPLNETLVPFFTLTAPEYLPYGRGGWAGGKGCLDYNTAALSRGLGGSFPQTQPRDEDGVRDSL